MQGLGFCSQTAWIGTWLPTLTTPETLRESLNRYDSQFLHLSSGHNNNNTYIIGRYDDNKAYRTISYLEIVYKCLIIGTI